MPQYKKLESWSLVSFLSVQLLFIPNANYRKKVHGVVLVYVLLSRLPPFRVFNVVNRSVYYSNIVAVFTISYHCTIFSPKGKLFYTDSSFHQGKLLPDEIQIKRNRTSPSLVLCHSPFKVWLEHNYTRICYPLYCIDRFPFGSFKMLLFYNCLLLTGLSSFYTRF